MYLIRIFPDERKQMTKAYLAMAWSKVLPDGNYNYADFISVIQQHRDELGIEISDSDIVEIINVGGPQAINPYMRYGDIESMGLNFWYERID